MSDQSGTVSALDPRPVALLARDFVVSPKEAAKILNLGVHTLRRLDKDGSGPEKIQLSKRRFGYRISAIERWLAERICKSPQPETPGRKSRGV